MGEMADYYLDSHDWYEEEDYELQPSYVTCKYCGEQKLVWFNFEELGWRLTKGKVPHACKEYKK